MIFVLVKNRAGDFHFYNKPVLDTDFEVANTESYCDKGLRISSTAVREALFNDDLALAESLLGHPL